MFDGNSCGIFSALHEQSKDINQGVERLEPQDQGAGDQGMMFGYACSETANYLPISLDLSHALVKELAAIRREGKVMNYLRPDSKSQVTVEYDDNGKPVRVHTIVISTQHDEFEKAKDEEDQKRADDVMLSRIKEDVRNILIPRVKAQVKQFGELIKDDYILHVNPTGKFVIGGPHGDTGLTGRKIIVDTYGGKGAHGGGAFSGKDPSKVDRSAAYAARHIAKNLVAAGVTDEVLVQVAYAIGIADPMNIYVNTYGKSKVNFTDEQIAEKVSKIFGLRPKDVEDRLALRNPIYEETASYGHVGRTCVEKQKTFIDSTGKPFTKTVKLFTWEDLDKVKDIKSEFGIN
jgi:S-adenosylmethionine synthetase